MPVRCSIFRGFHFQATVQLGCWSVKLGCWLWTGKSVTTSSDASEVGQPTRITRHCRFGYPNKELAGITRCRTPDMRCQPQGIREVSHRGKGSTRYTRWVGGVIMCSLSTGEPGIQTRILSMRLYVYRILTWWLLVHIFLSESHRQGTP